VNPSPPHTEHHSPVCSGKRPAAASADGLSSWALLGEEGNPLITAAGQSQTLRARVGAAANRERPGCHPAPALPSGWAFYSLILLKVSWATTQPAPHHMASRGPPFPWKCRQKWNPAVHSQCEGFPEDSLRRG